jgi:hypothetical protein
MQFKACEYCRRPFQPTPANKYHAEQRFCTPACRNRARR